MTPSRVDECDSNCGLVICGEFVEPAVKDCLIGLRCGRCRKTGSKRHDGHLSDSQGGHKPRTCLVKLCRWGGFDLLAEVAILILPTVRVTSPF